MSWRVRSMWYWFVAAAASALAVVVQLFRKRRRHQANVEKVRGDVARLRLVGKEMAQEIAKERERGGGGG